MNDLISRSELFNRLATIAAPPDANGFKAEIYNAINVMEAVNVAYVCNGEKCDHCSPDCDLTTDPKFAADPRYTIAVDACRPSWIPIEERWPEHSQVVLVSFGDGDMGMGRYRWDEGGGAFYPCGLPFTYSEMNIFVNAWMPLPEPYEPER